VLTSAASRRDLATAFQPVEVYRAVLGRFCRDVVRAERTASEDAAVWLHTVPRPTADPLLTPGFLPPLPRKHLSIWFGDGDSGKSLMAMYAAGLLAQGGMKVAYFDWELDASDHKERLARVFGEQEPTSLLYVKCDRPLVQMADSLASLIKKHGIEYAVFDSIGYACAEPEAADSANQYVLAVRKLGIGSLHIAHITKGGANAALKPFGSVFWHNGARSTWYVRREEEGSTFGIPFIKSTFVQRKSNFGSRNTDGIHVQVDFAAQYHIRGIEAPLITRVINALERGPLTREELDPLVRPQNKKSFQRALQRAVAKKELLEDESTGKLRLPEAANDEEDSDAA
jgi:hypothetical protein